MERTNLIRILRMVVIGVLILGGLVAVPVQSTELSEVLQTLKRSAAQIETLQARFVQEKKLAIFEQSLISEGIFLYRAPDHLRWELLTPVVSGFVLRGEEGTRWSDVSRQAENFSVGTDPIMGHVAQQLLAWARVDFDWLEQRYRMTLLSSLPTVLRLDPRDPDEAQFVDYLRVTLAPDQGYIAEIEVLEQQGDTTRWQFDQVERNHRLFGEAFLPPHY